MTEDEEFEALEQRLNYKHKEQAMNKQQEALKLALEALEETLRTLDDENAKPGGAISDTIWYSEHETLFDYLGAQIAAIRSALAERKSGIKQVIELYDSPEQPAQQEVDWEKLYRLEVKKKEALAAKYERDTGKKLTRIVPMAEQPAQQESEAVHAAWMAGYTEGEREAIEKQTAQEPVACKSLCELCVKRGYNSCANVAQTTPIPFQQPAQPAQPSKPWASLTDDEVAVMMMEAWGCASIAPRHAPAFARAIEAKLREKNEKGVDMTDN